MTWVLVLLLIVSVAANVYQAARWRVYRVKPAGNHSWEGMMPKVTRVLIEQNKVTLKKETNQQPQ